MTTLLEARKLTKVYPVFEGALRRTVGEVRAVDGIDLKLAAGETYGLVGESGSGKSTLGRCLLRLVELTGGVVLHRGQPLGELDRPSLRRRRRHLQMVFQDPHGSLNPRLRVDAIVGEALSAHRIVSRRDRPSEVLRLLALVGLDGALAARFPHQLSSGQRQRVGIARALGTRPELIIADEPVSALDVTVQAQIVNLLARLQRDLGLALLFISHDLTLVQRIGRRTGVLYRGRLVEEGPSSAVFSSPLHPHAALLRAAVPIADPDASRPSRAAAAAGGADPVGSAGCAFRKRCPIARSRCATETPDLRSLGQDRRVACHFPGELAVEESATFGGPDGTFRNV